MYVNSRLESPNVYQHYAYMIVDVEVLDVETDQTIAQYETDLADSSKRRVFTEQSAFAYAANQYLIVVPKRVQRRFPELEPPPRSIREGTPPPPAPRTTARSAS